MELNISIVAIIVEAVIAVVTIGVAYGIVKAKLAHLEKGQSDVIRRVEQNENKKADQNDLERVEREFKTHERDGVTVKTDIATIKADIKNIDKKLDRMNGTH